MNESGHAKNVANFASYISIVTTYGTIYKPPTGEIEIPALQTSLANFEAAKDSVTPKASAETESDHRDGTESEVAPWRRPARIPSPHPRAAP